MKTRELTVYKGRGSNYQLPQIVLQGQWLQSLGFSIGDKVMIISQQDRIIIMNAGNKENKGTELDKHGVRIKEVV